MLLRTLDKRTMKFLSEMITVRCLKILLLFLKRGKNNFGNSELDLASNLSSSTELEADIKHEEEKPIRRSKRLTKTNPIVRYNNPICHDYRKHRRKAELGSNTESHGNGDEQLQLIQTTDNKLISRFNTHSDNHTSEDRPTRPHTNGPLEEYRHIEDKQYPIGRTTANKKRGDVENIDNSYN